MSKPNAKRPKARRANRVPRLGDVLADLRDRISANGLERTRETYLVTHAIEAARHADAARHVTDSVLYLDATVAPDFREQMLAAAAAALCGVLNHDRRALAAQQGRA